MTEIHSCSYYCDRPECIKAQRDELRERLAQPEQEPAARLTCEELGYVPLSADGKSVYIDGVGLVRLAQPEQEPAARLSLLSKPMTKRRLNKMNKHIPGPMLAAEVQAALYFVLWHHQGANSRIGQPIREMLCIGPLERLTDRQIAGAKRVSAALVVQSVGRATDEQIKEWATRHDISGSLIELRAIFEDARSVAQPEQEPVKFNCTVVDDAHPEGVPLGQWGKQQKQKPFCYHDGRNIVGKEYADHSDVFPLYTRPQAREPLTDEEIEREWQFLYDEEGNPPDHHDFARAIEAKLKEKA